MVGGGFVAVADSAAGVGGRVVGVTVGGGLVGAETVTIGVGGAAVGEDADGDAAVQAVTKTTARIDAII